MNISRQKHVREVRELVETDYKRRALLWTADDVIIESAGE